MNSLAPHRPSRPRPVPTPKGSGGGRRLREDACEVLRKGSGGRVEPPFPARVIWEVEDLGATPPPNFE